jgi:ABC-2 type transport system permease protein
MNPMLALIERELRSAMRAPVALAVLGLYLILHGLFFTQLMESFSTQSLAAQSQGQSADQLNLVDQVLRSLVMGDAFILMLLLPALTMRLVADEWRQGTSDLLLSYPLREIDIVLGKYFAAVLMLLVMIVLGLLYPLGAGFLGRLEFSVALSGALGLLLFGMAIVAIGVFYSSLTENQLIAFISTFVTTFVMTTAGFWRFRISPPFDGMLAHLSPTAHVDAFGAGLLRLSDVVFFLSVAFFFLALTVGVFEARRWRSLGGSR